jgi:hypothetical protein
MELNNPQSIEQCKEYIDKEYHERFDELVKELKVKISRPTLTEKWNGIRNKYTVTLTRNGQRASFAFYDSIWNTESDETPTLYDILTILNREYMDGEQNAESRDLAGFIDDFGYTDIEDYPEAKAAYYEQIRHYKAFRKVLNSKEVEVLPN